MPAFLMGKKSACGGYGDEEENNGVIAHCPLLIVRE